MTQQATEDVLVRIPPLKQSDRIVITRADHGGYIVEVEALFPGSHTARTTAALSTYIDLQDWLHQVFIRWLPVTEWIPPAPPKKGEVQPPLPREDDGPNHMLNPSRYRLTSD